MRSANTEDQGKSKQRWTLQVNVFSILGFHGFAKHISEFCWGELFTERKDNNGQLVHLTERSGIMITAPGLLSHQRGG